MLCSRAHGRHVRERLGSGDSPEAAQEDAASLRESFATNQQNILRCPGTVQGKAQARSVKLLGHLILGCFKICHDSLGLPSFPTLILGFVQSKLSVGSDHEV